MAATHLNPVFVLNKTHVAYAFAGLLSVMTFSEMTEIPIFWPQHSLCHND